MKRCRRSTDISVIVLIMTQELPIKAKKEARNRCDFGLQYLLKFILLHVFHCFLQSFSDSANIFSSGCCEERLSTSASLDVLS